MSKVQILDENTANQIAAGEVVERPAAAVKELVENALDAGARRILVELDEGGKYLIRVTDDGSGMSREDAVLSLQRHATSKIRSADDLFQITTMGFRGEALPSIASVSQMSVVTKAAGDDEAAGVQIRCAGGSLEEVSEVGARTGTSITVENLFYNVPARLKFLKSSSTELGHIVETDAAVCAGPARCGVSAAAQRRGSVRVRGRRLADGRLRPCLRARDGPAFSAAEL